MKTIIRTNHEVPGARKLEPEELPNELLLAGLQEKAEMQERGERKPVYFYEIHVAIGKE